MNDFPENHGAEDLQTQSEHEHDLQNRIVKQHLDIAGIYGSNRGHHDKRQRNEDGGRQFSLAAFASTSR